MGECSPLSVDPFGSHPYSLAANSAGIRRPHPIRPLVPLRRGPARFASPMGLGGSRT
jgi:hypothetical protein